MNLNKISLIAAVAALMLTGCNNDLVLQSEASDKAIEFRTVMDKTRASLINNADELTSFFLHAGEAGEDDFDFMNVAAYRTGTYSYNWTYAPKKYWPNYALDFFAYAPIKDVNMAAEGPTRDEGTVSFEYTVPFDQSKSNTAVDLLVAHTRQNENDVLINFQHALSSVIFSAKNNFEGLVFTIHRIEITNLYNKGTYSSSVDNNNNVTGNWEIIQGGEGAIDYIAGIPESGVAVNPRKNGEENSNWLRLLSLNDYLMVLPQSFADVEDDVSVKVVFSATYEDGEPFFKDGKNTEYYTDDNKATVYFSLKGNNPINNEFLKGYRYNFQFILGDGSGGGEGENPNPNPSLDDLITLDVDVEQWVGYDFYNETTDDKEKGTPIPEVVEVSE